MQKWLDIIIYKQVEHHGQSLPVQAVMGIAFLDVLMLNSLGITKIENTV